MIGDIHSVWGWFTVGICGVVGVWGLVLAMVRRLPGRAYRIGMVSATVALLAQVAMGLYAFSVEKLQPGNQHVFYGVVVLFTLAFGYIYRVQLQKRPALAYGLFFLFLMGLGIRGIMTFGHNF